MITKTQFCRLLPDQYDDWLIQQGKVRTPGPTDDCQGPPPGNQIYVPEAPYGWMNDDKK